MDREDTWIFLRGLARERGHWGNFADEFRTNVGGRPDVVAIDLPGVGEFADVPSPRTIGGITAFVRARAAERAPGARVHLLSVSLGGMVALEWLRAWPDEVAGAVLINTSVAGLSPIHHRLRWQIWARFTRILTVQPPRERERLLTDLLINDPDQQARALVTWGKLAQERPVAYRTFATQLWAAARAGAAGVATGGRPGLILSGLGDRLVDPSCSTALAARTGWPLERHPWAGHDLTWDDAAWVITQVAAWRRATPPA